MLNNFNPDQYLYHFTTYTTALEHILTSRTLRFSPFSKTNDPRESKHWNFTLILSSDDNLDNQAVYNLQSEINKLLKNNTKLLCFTRDNILQTDALSFIRGRGFAHPRMWAQYAGNHTGICLVFDKYKLNKIIKNNFHDKGTVYHNNVSYGQFSENLISAFYLNYDDIKKDGIEECAKNHLNLYNNELFFSKTPDWKDEWEYRYVVFSNQQNEYENVKYEDALERIILGADFPRVYETLIVEYCKKYNISASKMFWNNGGSGSVGIYNHESGISKISSPF
ncbi:DUF2971 domain-containing protein [Bacillus sp. ISL-75]|uniref:DUF2971 domain-containing protein n=1 Tax=Bacillus sp. ISL-75 TaxID=2819137 RepID=UPI001BE710FA|nr:DUF2971 domain-containing protein [Bacillus sp. ISL-75]MBT2727821.1 DUF2971 domain-containing protein [Bacillus sp. ISL-75]